MPGLTLDDFLDGFNYRIIIWLFRQLFDILDVLNDTASIQNKNRSAQQAQLYDQYATCGSEGRSAMI